MERLTQRTNGIVVYVGAHNKEAGGQTPFEVSSRGIREILARLAEYEDAGLTPEDIEALKRDWSDLCTIVGECGGRDRVLELAEIDKEGRVVVLPCKVGDMVWVIGRDNVAREMMLEPPVIRTVCTDEDNLCMSTCNRKPDGFCAYRLRNDGSDINKAVFLTREDAEAALKRAENG